MKKQIWFQKWTEEYMEGLPVGNGRLAAMMLGVPQRLRLALNHEWLWKGVFRHREPFPAADHLQEVRDALLAGDFEKGTELCAAYFAGLKEYPRVDPFIPAGDLWVELSVEQVKNYTRSLDLTTGLATTSFDCEYGKITQELFVSSTDGCMVFRMKATRPVDLALCLSRIGDPDCTITYSPVASQGGNAGLYMKGAMEKGTTFAVECQVKTDGVVPGTPSEDAPLDHLQIGKATEVTVFLQIGTDAKGVSPDEELLFPQEEDVEVLLARHTERFTQLFGEAKLEVEVEDCELPTDERIRLFREDKEPAMPLLYFEYGRYLMVSSSSGELPMNLQGKWNENIKPDWESDYHLDVNLEMCYWFVETLGMKDAAETMLGFVESFLPHAQKVASEVYGCRGISMGLMTDAWGKVTPEAYGWCPWVGAAPWLGQHMFMHYRYTKDRAFLENHGYPYLKEAALFFEDYLIEKDGELWVVPSQSPENRFAETGPWPVSMGINSAMDRELITELLTNAAESAEILGVDPEKVILWRNMVTRLPKLTTDSIGRLNEWDKERVELEPGHRHLSHLYGLYPGQLFAPGSLEWKASEISLDERLSHGGGHTGWSRSWVACLMARLQRSEDAWSHFMALIGDFATISLLDLHPPRIFQIDGNMGGTACVCEMLMQSRRDQLLLLPALPKAWPNGSVTHFKGQDGIDVSFAWEKGTLVSFAIAATEDVRLQVVSGEDTWELTVKANETFAWKK